MSDSTSHRLVTILETGDMGLIAIVKSLLAEAEIEFWTEGEAIQTAIPGLNTVEFRVRAEDADRAKEVLAQTE